MPVIPRYRKPRRPEASSSNIHYPSGSSNKTEVFSDGESEALGVISLAFPGYPSSSFKLSVKMNRSSSEDEHEDLDTEVRHPHRQPQTSSIQIGERRSMSRPCTSKRCMAQDSKYYDSADTGLRANLGHSRPFEHSFKHKPRGMIPPSGFNSSYTSFDPLAREVFLGSEARIESDLKRQPELPNSLGSHRSINKAALDHRQTETIDVGESHSPGRVAVSRNIESSCPRTAGDQGDTDIPIDKLEKDGTYLYQMHDAVTTSQTGGGIDRGMLSLLGQDENISPYSSRRQHNSRSRSLSQSKPRIGKAHATVDRMFADVFKALVVPNSSDVPEDVAALASDSVFRIEDRNCHHNFEEESYECRDNFDLNDPDSSSGSSPFGSKEDVRGQQEESRQSIQEEATSTGSLREKVMVSKEKLVKCSGEQDTADQAECTDDELQKVKTDDRSRNPQDSAHCIPASQFISLVKNDVLGGNTPCSVQKQRLFDDKASTVDYQRSCPSFVSHRICSRSINNSEEQACDERTSAETGPKKEGFLERKFFSTCGISVIVEPPPLHPEQTEGYLREGKDTESDSSGARHNRLPVPEQISVPASEPEVVLVSLRDRQIKFVPGKMCENSRSEEISPTLTRAADEEIKKCGVASMERVSGRCSTVAQNEDRTETKSLLPDTREVKTAGACDDPLIDARGSSGSDVSHERYPGDSHPPIYCLKIAESRNKEQLPPSPRLPRSSLRERSSVVGKETVIDKDSELIHSEQNNDHPCNISDESNQHTKHETSNPRIPVLSHVELDPAFVENRRQETEHSSDFQVRRSQNSTLPNPRGVFSEGISEPHSCIEDYHTSLHQRTTPSVEPFELRHSERCGVTSPCDISDRHNDDLCEQTLEALVAEKLTLSDLALEEARGEENDDERKEDDEEENAVTDLELASVSCSELLRGSRPEKEDTSFHDDISFSAPGKTHSLLTACDGGHSEPNVTEVMAIISQEVSIKRYPSFPDLTDLNDDDDPISASRDGTLNLQNSPQSSKTEKESIKQECQKSLPSERDAVPNSPEYGTLPGSRFVETMVSLYESSIVLHNESGVGLHNTKDSPSNDCRRSESVPTNISHPSSLGRECIFSSSHEQQQQQLETTTMCTLADSYELLPHGSVYAGETDSNVRLPSPPTFDPSDREENNTRPSDSSSIGSASRSSTSVDSSDVEQNVPLSPTASRATPPVPRPLLASIGVDADLRYNNYFALNEDLSLTGVLVSTEYSMEEKRLLACSEMDFPPGCSLTSNSSHIQLSACSEACELAYIPEDGALVHGEGPLREDVHPSPVCGFGDAGIVKEEDQEVVNDQEDLAPLTQSVEGHGHEECMGIVSCDERSCRQEGDINAGEVPSSQKGKQPEGESTAESNGGNLEHVFNLTTGSKNSAKPANEVSFQTSETCEREDINTGNETFRATHTESVTGNSEQENGLAGENVSQKYKKKTGRCLAIPYKKNSPTNERYSAGQPDESAIRECNEESGEVAGSNRSNSCCLQTRETVTNCHDRDWHLNICELLEEGKRPLPWPGMLKSETFHVTQGQKRTQKLSSVKSDVGLRVRVSSGQSPKRDNPETSRAIKLKRNRAGSSMPNKGKKEGICRPTTNSIERAKRDIRAVKQNGLSRANSQPHSSRRKLLPDTTWAGCRPRRAKTVVVTTTSVIKGKIDSEQSDSSDDDTPSPHPHRQGAPPLVSFEAKIPEPAKENRSPPHSETTGTGSSVPSIASSMTLKNDSSTCWSLSDLNVMSSTTLTEENATIFQERHSSGLCLNDGCPSPPNVAHDVTENDSDVMLPKCPFQHRHALSSPGEGSLRNTECSSQENPTDQTESMRMYTRREKDWRLKQEQQVEERDDTYQGQAFDKCSKINSTAQTLNESILSKSVSHLRQRGVKPTTTKMTAVCFSENEDELTRSTQKESKATSPPKTARTLKCSQTHSKGVSLTDKTAISKRILHSVNNTQFHTEIGSNPTISNNTAYHSSEIHVENSAFSGNEGTESGGDQKGTTLSNNGSFRESKLCKYENFHHGGQGDIALQPEDPAKRLVNDGSGGTDGTDIAHNLGCETCNSGSSSASTGRLQTLMQGADRDLRKAFDFASRSHRNIEKCDRLLARSNRLIDLSEALIESSRRQMMNVVKSLHLNPKL